MVRPNRVLSFMSEWGGNAHLRKNSNGGPQSPSARQPQPSGDPNSSNSSTALDNFDHSPHSPSSLARSDSRPSSRPMSMIQTYQPPVMEVSQDTLPELQRIFTFLNSHSNKLYQEGYFLKFHDTDSRGRPAPDRVWQECFAQLVGTILSLWDASELDTVGRDAEVLPTFINLTDAAIHMMPSMVLNDGKRLDNVLSISTAASNKYLFHFNSFNSLTQWTAGIRLAIYEHTTLQEAYTGALIAGKGKTLNNIRMILDRQRAKHEDWARVRFGAGTPWRRCWCVVNPPDEKEFAKLQKSQKKSNIYNRSPIVLKGDVKFYDTKKVTKKTRPIATVTEAYSCYAIYPQSKPLIDQSTLVKIEGKITIHSNPDSVTEGFVFVMPESHPMVTGFEIMLRFLFPVFDTFALYGRPGKLIADVLDSRGLMFAMPSDRRYGYLEMWDVVSLIHTEGSQNWSERQWRKQLKELTSTRMLAANSRATSRAGSRRNTMSRTSAPPSRAGTLRFDDRGSIRSQPTTRQPSPTRGEGFDPQGDRPAHSAPPTSGFPLPRHQRSVSETNGYKRYQTETPSRLAHGVSVDGDYDSPPPPPPHHQLNDVPQNEIMYGDSTSSGEPSPNARELPELQVAPTEPPRGPVASPPSFAHAPGQRPPVQPYHPPPMMKPNTQMDPATLHQLEDATHAPLPAEIAAAGAAAAWRSQENVNSRRSGDSDRDGQQRHLGANSRPSYPADQYANSSRSGHPGSRLPTIPASPYIEQPEFVGSSPAYQPTAATVPEEAQYQSQSPVELAYRTRSNSGGQISRKPVPGRSSISSSRGESDSRSTTSSNLGSLRNHIIDPDALDRLNTDLVRNPSMSSSFYGDDTASSSTPDYASTASEEVQSRKLPEGRQERPRSGMLRTIGNPDLNPKSDVVVGDAHYKPDARQTEIATDIPRIDFGPTYSLAPTTVRPGTSGTLTQALHDSGDSPLKGSPRPSPGENARHSWLSGRTTPDAATHMRTSSASPRSQDVRTVAWQPGMSPQSHSERQKIDADEWVAQRAAAAYQPLMSPAYTHSRSKSHTPPPVKRTHSGDWTQLPPTPEGPPSRPPSRPLSRPLSRGAGNILDQRPSSRGAGNILDQRPSSRGAGNLLDQRPSSRGAGNLLDQRPTSLSAREQEHVARMTGTPLIDLQHNAKKLQEPQAEGLTAYIDHREKEKAKAKAGRSTAAMQAEMDRRMMAAQQRQMSEMQHMGQQMPMPAGGYGSPTMIGTPQGYPQAYAYSSPDQVYPPQGYFPQQRVLPQPPQQGWGTPTQQQMQGPYFAQQQHQQLQQQLYGTPPPQQQFSQPYGASFDQAQAAARFAHQRGPQYRQG